MYNIILLILFDILKNQSINYDEYFTSMRMRVDYFHVGSQNTEEILLDEIIKEPSFGGNRINLIDFFNYGKYKFEVYDKITKKLIYSGNYSTLFGEWQTTDEAKSGVKRIFHESIIFPYPKKEIILKIYSKNFKGEYSEISNFEIDPNSYKIKYINNPYDFEIVKILYNGESAYKVDIVIIGDGYQKEEMEKFIEDVFRFKDIFFKWSPFREHKNDFNIWAVKAISKESGVTEPRKGIYKNTILKTHFNTFDLERYLTTNENKILRDVISSVPYDTILIMVNTSRYGGAGIFNFYAVFISDNEYDDYVFIHEFGHSFGGLADEYYDSAVSYNEFYPDGFEPSEPNITAYLNPAELKWKDLLTPSVPIPTPEDIKYKNVVGLFEGAGYRAKGLFRPSLDCKMFSKSHVEFCKVCKKNLEKMIDFYTKKL